MGGCHKNWVNSDDTAMKDLLTRRLLPFIQRCLVPPPWWRQFWWNSFLLLPLYHVIDNRYKRGEDQSLNEVHTHYPKWQIVPSLPYPFLPQAIFRPISQNLASWWASCHLGANMRLLTSLGSFVDEMCSTPASGGCPWCNENFFHPSSSFFFFVHLCKKWSSYLAWRTSLQRQLLC